MDSPRREAFSTRSLFPTRAIALLMLVGFTDLVATAMLHSTGSIVELNPLMKPFIEQGEWLFILVKLATLVGAWYAMVSYCRINLAFVRRAALVGTVVYLSVWMAWFVVAHSGV